MTEPPTEQPTEPPTEQPDQRDPRYGRLRRAPRYGSFVATGALLGIAIGVVLAAIEAMRSSGSGEFSVNTVLGYVAATLGLLGALLGGCLAVLLDRRKPKRSSRTGGEEGVLDRP